MLFRSAAGTLRDVGVITLGTLAVVPVRLGRGGLLWLHVNLGRRRRLDDHRRVSRIRIRVPERVWADEHPRADEHVRAVEAVDGDPGVDRKSTRLNSSHGYISYAVFCLKKKKKKNKYN